MITTCKQLGSRGRANERARTGIESERARAVFQNIHSHIGQWTFGYILSSAEEGGSSLNAWDLRKEFDRAWEWQCHGSRQRTLLKPPQTACDKKKQKHCHSCTSFFCFYDFLRANISCSSKKVCVNKVFIYLCPLKLDYTDRQ